MNKSEIRHEVFKILDKTPQTNFRAVESELRLRVEAYDRRDILTLNEVLWELLVQGVLAPGKNSLNPDLPFIHVTEYGARCIEDGSILVHDPDGFAERLRAASGERIAPVVMEGAREGLISLLGGHHVAALLLLAHAAESIVNELRAELIRSGRKAGRGTAQLETEQTSSPSRTSAIRRALLARRPPPAISDKAESHLHGLSSTIRLVRARDGSPLLPAVERDVAYARFLLFPDHCRFAYDAIAWLNGSLED